MKNAKRRAKLALLMKNVETFGILAVVNVVSFAATYYGKVPMLSGLSRGVFYLTVMVSYLFFLRAKAEWAALR